MAKKIFKFADVFYKVLDEHWLDDDTYVIVCDQMVDADGDEYHLEIEYHKDEERITYTRVYEFENVSADYLITPKLKGQMEEYILHQVGVLRKDSLLEKQVLNVELTLDVPQNLSVGELNNWLKNVTIEVNRIVPTKHEELASKVKILGIKVNGVNHK